MFAYFKNLKEKAFKEGVNVGLQKASELRFQEIQQSHLFEAERLVGKLIIVVSNEFENICVGYANRVVFITKAQSPIVEFTNIVTGETQLAAGIAFPYTEQKFNALNTMDRNALTALFYFRDSDYVAHKTLETDTMLDAVEWDRLVKEALLKYQ